MTSESDDLEQTSVSLWTYCTIAATTLFPAFGVIVLGWSLIVLLAFYWLETVVLGIMNVPKIYLASRSGGHGDTDDSPWGEMASFAFGYGTFCVMYLVFFVGCVVGVAVSPVRDHDYFYHHTDLETTLMSVGVGLAVVVCQELVDMIIDGSHRGRTAEQQSNKAGKRLIEPWVLGLFVVVILVISRSLTAAVVLTAVVKAWFEIKKVRARSTSKTANSEKE